MRMWAFATAAAPMGLGLRDAEFWYLDHVEYAAKLRVWREHRQDQYTMLAVLRADFHNGMMPRKNGKAYTAQEFGAPGKKSEPGVIKKWTPQEFQQRVESQRVDKENPKQKLSVVASLKGQGQELPRKKA